MKRFVFAYFLFCSSFIIGQKSLEIPYDLGRSIEKNYVTYPSQDVFLRSYGETWFTTVLDLVNIGEIEPLSNEQSGQQALLVSIFPDSTIIAGVDAVSGKPYYTFLHGMAEIINPSKTPSQWANEWTEIVIDSVEIPFAYVRNTPDSIIDTLFVDYIKSVPDSFLNYYDLNQNGGGDFGEFPHQPIFHTDDKTNRLDPVQIFRTDTVLLTLDDSSSIENLTVKYKGIDVNDTVPGKTRYGVYIRFQPGYEWTLQDSLKDFNEFLLLTREQEVGESPRQIWPFTSGFCSYAMNRSIRYNQSEYDYLLLPGVVPIADWQLEHLIISYKFTTNALTVNNPEYNVGVQVFPNPMNSVLNLGLSLNENQEINVEIYDLTGKLVLNEDLGLVPAGTFNHSVNIQVLSAGIYSLKVAGVTRKLVVK